MLIRGEGALRFWGKEDKEEGVLLSCHTWKKLLIESAHSKEQRCQVHCGVAHYWDVDRAHKSYFNQGNGHYFHLGWHYIHLWSNNWLFLVVVIGLPGALYPDGTSGHLKQDDSVPPGGSYTYRWEVRPEFAPTDDDANCLTWAYHSHLEAPRDIASGLIGALLTCKKGIEALYK